MKLKLGPGYRFLKPSERTKDGDECRDCAFDATLWRPVPAGKLVYAGEEYVYRRPISEHPSKHGNQAMKFIRIKSYIRPGEPAVEFVINIDQIVSFFERTCNDGTPYVYLDTTRQSGLHIAGTVEELVARIEQVEEGSK